MSAFGFCRLVDLDSVRTDDGVEWGLSVENRTITTPVENRTITTPVENRCIPPLGSPLDVSLAQSTAVPDVMYTSATQTEFFESSPPDASGRVAVLVTQFFDGEVDFERVYSLALDVDLLQRALDRITEYPETWDQEIWASPCGTTRCLAGMVMGLAESRRVVRITTSGMVQFRKSSGDVSTPVLISDLALSLLTPAHAPEDTCCVEYLWDSNRTLTELWGIAQVLSGGRLNLPASDVIEAAQRRSVSSSR